VWKALATEHARFAIGNDVARRYPADVAPFAALADHRADALAQLEKLLAADERLYVIGALPESTTTLDVGKPLRTFQMLGPSPLPAEHGAGHAQPMRLGAEDAAAMVALTDLAFPGFFRPRTYEMGNYYGIRIQGELIAMAGERLAIPGYREISAVCTHPAHTGKGYARMLTTLLLHQHAKAGLKSFLHVAESNTRALAVYERLGFRVPGSAMLWPLSRRI
jgi:ribosomal protein S18 acetylase RimI-like enzyme